MILFRLSPCKKSRSENEIIFKRIFMELSLKFAEFLKNQFEDEFLLTFFSIHDILVPEGY